MVCSSTFPPTVGAAGLASSFAGFGPQRGASASSSSSFSDAEPPLVRRVSSTPDAPVRGAFQHCALFKNILVAADGDNSARLRVFDVRDWTEKQTIRVGAVSERGDAADDDADARTIAAAVSALAFDGTTIVAATHEGFVHTWRLMARGEKRGYVRLLQPLRVDGVPVTKARILGEPGSQLLACHAPSKRAFVVWELDTGKLRGAFNTDGVAKGVPLLLVESCATVMACVHADADAETESASGKRNTSKSARAPVAALLDVRTGEGGALRDSDLLANKGTPTCAAFDGELFVVATSLGVLIAWNLQTGDAPAIGAHAGAANAAAVGAVKVVPGEPSRILSGGADRALLLWDKALRPLARLELGSPVTCLAVSTPRLAVAGTQDGFVEVFSLPAPDDAEPDKELVEARRAKAFLPTEDFSSAAAGVVPAYRYALRHDPGSAPSSFASFDAFTRRVPVWEGAYVPPTEGEAAKKPPAGPEDAGGSSSGFSASRALAGSAQSASPEEEASRVKREEEEARAKQRAMDGAGVARDPNVRATADGARCCSNPTCVAREDTLGSGRSMLRCSRCKSARYCSTHCQRTHWRDGHKGKCVAPGEATAKETPAAAAPPAPAPAPAPARRALVVESESDESDESDSDSEAEAEAEASVASPRADANDIGSAETETAASASADARVVSGGSGSETETEISILETAKDKNFAATTATTATTEGEDDALDDDLDAPALPPWMTSHAPPGVSKRRTSAEPRAEAPPAARKMAVSGVGSRETPAAGPEARLEPLDEHDLLYELD